MREANVYSEIVAPTITAQEIAARNPTGIIFSGGPASVHVEGAILIDPEVYDLDVPILGICYGAQMIAQQKGGRVDHSGRGEYGRTTMSLDADGGCLLGDTPEKQQVWMSHFDAIVQPPNGVTATASTSAAAVAAFEGRDRKLYGVQFHPEVIHTTHGQHVIERFLTDACGSSGSWTMGSIIDTAVAQIREQVGDHTAICGLSGGVDSAVAATLVHKAIGDQLTCVFVDTGLMRLNEGDQVVETFERNFGVRLVHAQAQDRFLLRWRVSPNPRRNEKPSENSSFVSSKEHKPKRERPVSWFRERCIPMSLSREGSMLPRSRVTTMLADCPTTSNFLWSNLSGVSSKTRFAR